MQGAPIGLENFEFEMRPAFIAGQDALWGRADFLMTFGLIVDEPKKMLALILPAGEEDANMRS
jgi:hypothetical protein